MDPGTTTASIEVTNDWHHICIEHFEARSLDKAIELPIEMAGRKWTLWVYPNGYIDGYLDNGGLKPAHKGYVCMAL